MNKKLSQKRGRNVSALRHYKELKRLLDRFNPKRRAFSFEKSWLHRRVQSRHATFIKKTIFGGSLAEANKEWGHIYAISHAPKTQVDKAISNYLQYVAGKKSFSRSEVLEQAKERITNYLGNTRVSMEQQRMLSKMELKRAEKGEDLKDFPAAVDSLGAELTVFNNTLVVVLRELNVAK